MDIDKQMRIITQGVSELINEKELRERLKQAEKNNSSLKIKLGLDPSAPDIHLGHTVVLQKMKQFQELGHQVVIIIGDFTGRIGDPSGRSETRPQLSEEEIQENAKTYREQIFKVLNKEQTTVMFNSEWLSPMSFSDVIKLASSYTVARMLERDDFATRFEGNKPIGIHEFFYPLMQAYDSVAIEADVEIGGTDQKFNLLVGRHLQREFGQKTQAVILMPILEGTDGTKKMSKSLNNYIGVQEKPSEIYGKVMSIPDDLIVRYYEMVTDFDLNHVNNLKEKLEKDRLHPMEAKKELAFRIVSIYYDLDSAASAEKQFEKIFRDQKLPDDIPEKEIQKDQLDEDSSIWIVELLDICSLVNSRSDARRMIKQGAVKIDGKKVEKIGTDIKLKEGIVVQVGKRRFKRITLI